MNYTEMCRYIVAREGMDWEGFLRCTKSREQLYKTTRHICMYIGHRVLHLSTPRLAGIFGQNHPSALHAIKTITNDYNNYGHFAKKIDQYICDIRTIIEHENNDYTAAQVIDITATTIEKMRIIAEAYCEITGKRIV